MKKLISLILALCMVLSLSVTASAAGNAGSYGAATGLAELNLPKLDMKPETLAKSLDRIVKANCWYIASEAKKIQAMNIDQLNAYIDARISTQKKAVCNAWGKYSPVATAAVGTRGSLPVLGVKILWLAAAQAARLAGYTCSATLIEYSVLGIPYNENGDSQQRWSSLNRKMLGLPAKASGGLFHDKIVATQTYKDFMEAIKAGTKQTGVEYVLSHSRGENADLYFSLHSCTYTAKESGEKYAISVYDVYDFHYSEFDNLFVELINNWAWFCQNIGALDAISVNISWME